MSSILQSGFEWPKLVGVGAVVLDFMSWLEWVYKA